MEAGVDFNAEFIFGFPNFELLSGMVRANLGFSLNNQGDTSKVYSGLLWEYMWDPSLFLNLGLGLAAHDGELDNSDDKKELGSRILFRIPIEIGLLFTRYQGNPINHLTNSGDLHSYNPYSDAWSSSSRGGCSSVIRTKPIAASSVSTRKAIR